MRIGYVLEPISPPTHVDHSAFPEMVEPLEETRSELIFATEPLLSSLYLSIPNSIHRSPIVELDEVEVSTHHSARLILFNDREPFSRSRKASFKCARASPSSTPPHA